MSLHIFNHRNSKQKQIEVDESESSTTSTGIPMTSFIDPEYDNLVQTQLHYISYNENKTLFTVGSDKGFSIFSVSSPACDVKYKKEFTEGGVAIVHLLSSYSNTKASTTPFPQPYVALVGGGPTPIQPTNHCIFYDCEKGKVKGELICSDQILNIKSCYDGRILIVVMEDSINMYRMKDSQQHARAMSVGSAPSATTISSSPSTSAPLESELHSTASHSHKRQKSAVTKHVTASPAQEASFDWNSYKLEKSFQTGRNVNGLVSFIQESEDVFMLAYPHSTKGNVQIDWIQIPKSLFPASATSCMPMPSSPKLSPTSATSPSPKQQNATSSSYNTISISKSKVIHAHESSIIYLTFSQSGTKLATAGEKGTRIRLFSSHTGEKLLEFKRGSTEAQIFCLAFSHDEDYIACTSNSGTLHIFSMKTEDRSSYLSRVWDDSERSIYQYKGVLGASICAFSNTNNKSLSLITSRGLFVELKFDVKKEPTFSNTIKFYN